MQDKNFPQIKRDLIDRVEAIEKFIIQTEEERKQTINILNRLHLKINGDEDANPPRKGMDYRLGNLEDIENGRDKAKNYLLKIAVGSITFAVGGAVVWVLNVLRDAFIIKTH